MAENAVEQGDPALLAAEHRSLALLYHAIRAQPRVIGIASSSIELTDP
jgi:hypothetical protein